MISADLDKAARLIRTGGVVAYPTEYCFGLGCDPMNRAAVLRLLRLKRRPVGKGLILIAAEVSQLAPYLSAIPEPVRSSWPGPYTWLLPPRKSAPGWITGKHPKIAVRVTAHPVAAALCRAAGIAIVSTSANRGGGLPLRTDRDVDRLFGWDLDVVLRGVVGDAPAPTSIRDADTGELVRPG